MLIDSKLYQKLMNADILELVLKGSPGGKGLVVIGNAKVAQNFAYFVDPKNIHKEDIIVVPFAYPPDEPYIERSAGLITDRGTCLSHGSIICHYLDKPCVPGTTNGTSKLKNGEKIVVDGGVGTVYRVKDSYALVLNI